MRMPEPTTRTTFGTSTSSVATLRLNLPGTLKAASRPDGFESACMAAITSTTTSKVPRMPVSVAPTPLPLWPAAACAPPKARLAVFTSMATVAVSLPSLNVVPASPMDGPGGDGGPRLIVFDAVPDVLASLATVNVATLRPGFTGPLVVCTNHVWFVVEPNWNVGNSMLTAPFSHIWFVATLAFGVRKYLNVVAFICSGSGVPVMKPLVRSRLAAPGPLSRISSPSMPWSVPAWPATNVTSMYGRDVRVRRSAVAPLSGLASVAIGTGGGTAAAPPRGAG